MNLNIDSLLFERMADGVFFLNEQGQTVDFNRAARRWLQSCAYLEPQLGQLIKSMAQTAVLAPVDVTALFQSWATDDPVDVYLCKSDPHGYSLVFFPLQRQTSSAASSAPSEGQVFALLGEELRHEMTVLRGHLAQLSMGYGSETDMVVTQSDRLSKLLVATGQLSQLSDRNTVFQDSQLFLSELVEKVLTELPVRKSGYAVKTRPDNLPAKYGMLYGDEGWLKFALQGLLVGIGHNAPPDCQIRLHVREHGGFVVLEGGFAKAARATGPSISAPVSHLTASSPIDTDTRLHMYGRIVKRYGGQLEVTNTRSESVDEHPGGFDSFIMTLPIGGSARSDSDAKCGSCLFSKQAELYAKDLASLLPSRRQSSVVSHPPSDLQNKAKTGLVSNLNLELL